MRWPLTVAVRIRPLAKSFRMQCLPTFLPQPPQARALHVRRVECMWGWTMPRRPLILPEAGRMWNGSSQKINCATQGLGIDTLLHRVSAYDAHSLDLESHPSTALFQHIYVHAKFARYMHAYPTYRTCMCVCIYIYTYRIYILYVYFTCTHIYNFATCCMHMCTASLP